MDTSPGAEVAGTWDLLHLIGLHIRNVELLRSLCLVSKIFHDVFNPFLYSELPFRKCNLDMDKNPYLCHVKRFDCRGRSDAYSVGQLVQKMPLLEVLEITDTDSDTMETIKRYCPRLRSFAFCRNSYHDRDQDDEFEATGPWQAVGHEEDGSPQWNYVIPFPNLSSLFLSEMDGDLQKWKSDIIGILKASPGLQELWLSISSHTVENLQFKRRSEKYYSFFYKLCEDYEEAGCSPLRLRSLRLGLSVLLVADSPVAAEDSALGWKATYLSKLTDLSVLEEIHVNNQNLYHIVRCIELDESDSELAWGTFAPQFTPNLRRFTGYEYTHEVHKHIRDCFSPEFSKKLAVSFAHLGLNNHRSREIEDLMDPEGAESDSDEDSQSVRASQPLRFRMVDVSIPYYDPDAGGPQREAIVAKMAGQWDTLEGISILYPCGWDTELFWGKIDVLVEILSRPEMAKLRQLQFGFLGSKYEQLEAATALSCFGDDLEAARLAFARRLADAGGGLHHVKVGRRAWRIQRDAAGKTERLDELDEREEMEVERFRPPEPLWPLSSIDSPMRQSFAW